MRQPPWYWRFVIIPLREHVWYPLKLAAHTFRCDFFGLHRYRPAAALFSARRGNLLLCERCGKAKWER